MERLRFVDALRGIAIILMIAYHVLFTISYFGLSHIELGFGPLSLAPYFIGAMFVAISGLVSANSSPQRQQRKGIELGLIAIGISIATFLFDSAMFIKFGVIHLLAVCAFASIWIREIDRWKLIVLAGVSIYLGFVFSTLAANSPYMFPLGIVTSDYRAFDHYPIFPWIGVFSIGLLLGRELGGNLEKINSKYRKIDNAILRFLEWVGKKSIQIYILHEPIIVAIIILIK